MNTKKTISVAMAAIMMLSILAIVPAVAPGAESPATQTTIGDVPSYVEDKCELPDYDSGAGGTQIMPIMGTDKTVTKCAVVCDANDEDDISTVEAHVFYPDGTTKDAETLAVCSGSECDPCSFTGGGNCKVYTGTFTLSSSDPAGFYTVAIWAAGGGTKNAIITGADRLVANQNGDGGWGWPTGEPSYTNLAGVTAKGLYYAYKLTEDEDYMTAMENAVGYIQDHPPTYEGCTETVSGCDSNKDILFLAELALLTNNDTIAQLAKDRWDNKKAACGGADAVARQIVDARKDSLAGLVGWDLGDWVLALYELAEYYPGQGYITDANAIANTLNTALDNGDFNMSDPTEPTYYLGLAGVKEAFHTTGTHGDKLTTATTNLKAGQKADGSWPGDTTATEDIAQATAYATMALEMQGERDLASAGAKWLIDNQNPNGYWGTEYDEVTSEGTWAIAMLIMEQNRFEYLELAALDIDTNTINFGAVNPGITTTVTGDTDMGTTGAPTVKNVGNVELDAKISGIDMSGSGTNIIPVGSLNDQFDALGWTALSTTPSLRDINLGLGNTESLSCRLTPPIGTKADSYIGDITVTAEAS